MCLEGLTTAILRLMGMSGPYIHRESTDSLIKAHLCGVCLKYLCICMCNEDYKHIEVSLHTLEA